MNNMPLALNRPIGIFVHLFYEDLAAELADYLVRIDLPKTIYVSTNSEDKLRFIDEVFRRFGLASAAKFTVVPNVGYDIAPFLFQFREKFSEHDIYLKLHGKKSANERVEYGERWRDHLYEELIGDSRRVRAIVRTMLSRPELGILMAQHYYAAQSFINMGRNYSAMRRVLSEIGVDLWPNQPIDFPSGSMFWFRREALAELAGLGFKWSDFDTGSFQRDGTLAHAIERCFLFFSAAAGKRWGLLPSYRSGPRDSREDTIHLIRASGAFDEEYYKAAYPDVREVGIDPIQHWVDSGAREARNPSDPRYSNPIVYDLLERHLRGTPVSPPYRSRGDSSNPAIFGLAADAEIRCMKAPSFAPEVALFVSYSTDGSLKPSVLHYVDAFRREGVAVVLVVNTDELFNVVDPSLLASVDGLFIRDNKGYDFAAWAHVIQLHRELLEAEILYLVNDSLIGPNDQDKFRDVLQKVRVSKADVVGLTESLEGCWHLQSFFVALKAYALRSRAFFRFIHSIVCYEDKDDVVCNYELQLGDILKSDGLDCECIFSAEDSHNMTVYYWRELLDSGFPFVKSFIFFNPDPYVAGLLSARGFNVEGRLGSPAAAGPSQPFDSSEIKFSPLELSDPGVDYCEVGPTTKWHAASPTFVIGPFPEFISRYYFSDIKALSVGCYDLKRVSVISHGLLVQDGTLLTCDQLHLNRSSIMETVGYGNVSFGNRITRSVDGPVVSLTGPGHLIYGHWLADFLPKLFLLQRSGINPFEVKYLLPSDTPSFALSWLRLLGVSDSQLVFFEPYSEAILVNHLIAPTLLRSNGRTHPLFGAAIDYIVSLFRGTVGQSNGQAAEQRIYLARGDTKLSFCSQLNDRRLLNREMIEEAAQGAGYMVVRPETLSIVDQIEMFRRANCIVGEYGSALHGSVFSRPGTLVCALRATALHPGFLQSGLCQSMQQKIGYVFGWAAEHGARQEFSISKDDFETALNMIN